MKPSVSLCNLEIVRRASALVLLLALGACGGGGGGYGGDDQPPSPNTFTIGGTVSGLSSSGLVLRNNGGNDLSISSNGAFTFSTSLASGAAYAVTIATQPTGQLCNVTNGSGTVTAHVTNVAVSCSNIPPNTFTIGGTVSGLSSSGLVLQNNGGNDLPITGNGEFTFTTPLSNGATYAVTIATQPNTQDCAIAQGSGTANANVTNVTVTCGALPPLSATTDPADAATDVPRNVQPAVTFSAPLDATTLAGIRLVNDLSEVDVLRTLSGGIATLTPTTRLLPNLQHRMLVSPAVRSTRGQTLLLGVSHTFTTASQSWRESQLASGLEVTSQPLGSSVVVDSAGNALAAWISVNSRRGVSVSRYDASTGTWGAPVLLTGDSGESSQPQLAMDESGNALLVWQHLNVATPQYRVVFASRFHAATRTWEAPFPISHVDGSHNGSASLAVEPNGDIVVVWKRTEVSLTEDSIWMNRSNTARLADGSWVPWQANPGRVDVDGGGIPHDDALISGAPVVAMKAGTRIVVAWSRRESAQNRDLVIWTQVYQNGVSPSPEDVVSPEPGCDATNPQLVMDGDNAIVVWNLVRRADGDNFLIARPFQSSADAWGPAWWVNNERSDRKVRSVRLATNRAATGASRIAVSWMQLTNDTTGNVRAAFLDGDARPINKFFLDPQGAHTPGDAARLVVDPSANVLVVWRDPATANLASRRYSAASGDWADQEDLGTGLEFSGYIGAVAVNQVGDIVVVWPDSTGHNSGEAALRSRHFE